MRNVGKHSKKISVVIRELGQYEWIINLAYSWHATYWRK